MNVTIPPLQPSFSPHPLRGTDLETTRRQSKSTISNLCIDNHAKADRNQQRIICSLVLRPAGCASSTSTSRRAPCQSARQTLPSRHIPGQSASKYEIGERFEEGLQQLRSDDPTRIRTHARESLNRGRGSSSSSSASIYGDDLLHRHWTPRQNAPQARLMGSTCTRQRKKKRLQDPSTTNRIAIIPTSNVTAKFPALIGTQVVSDACVYCVVSIYPARRHG